MTVLKTSTTSNHGGRKERYHVTSTGPGGTAYSEILVYIRRCNPARGNLTTKGDNTGQRYHVHLFQGENMYHAYPR